ncbi:Transposase (plasmid) [Mycetohabitans rhizoxinica HKI 454]|uniref:Transposase n=1 Tax=Mycetohabitans rhizoxinica (strain DSM 19002 / CIP 109453 / HKI 454) TaxID=882378 RepID=E5AUH5_MYCRK|nr:Transposase [Mycetohabitans rhizoxinica HKI 454]
MPRLGYRRMSAWLALGESRVRRMWQALQLNIAQRCPRRRRCGNDIGLPGATQPNSDQISAATIDRLLRDVREQAL